MPTSAPIEQTDTYVEFYFDPNSDDPIDVPSGSNWECLLFASTVREDDDQPRARAAVTIADLLGLIIDGYDTIDRDDDAFMARYYAARDIAGEVQAVFNAQAIQANSGDLTAPENDVLWADKDTAPTVAAWDGPAPLVLIRTDYAPFSDRPAPTGAVVWIDPSDERSMVESLSVAGFAQLSVRDTD